jgi:hypothetical protein
MSARTYPESVTLPSQGAVRPCPHTLGHRLPSHLGARNPTQAGRLDSCPRADLDATRIFSRTITRSPSIVFYHKSQEWSYVNVSPLRMTPHV